MELICTEGIILHTLQFKDYDLIATVFSPDWGVNKFFVKGALRPSKKGTVPSLLSKCELIFRQGKGDFLICEEVIIVNHYLQLRKDFATLDAACRILQMIIRSQMPGRPAPGLYKLLIKYLEGLASFDDPRRVAVASFQLKLLRYEGHFDLEEGEDGVCIGNTIEGKQRFEAEEARVLRGLSYCRKLSDIKDMVLSVELEGKIKGLLGEHL